MLAARACKTPRYGEGARAPYPTIPHANVTIVPSRDPVLHTDSFYYKVFPHRNAAESLLFRGIITVQYYILSLSILITTTCCRNKLPFTSKL